MTPSPPPPRPPGRPREFDPQHALDQALGAFRERGYGAASIAVLGQAMGLTTGSIYKAFGGKRRLFREAYERYVQARGALLQQRLAPLRSGRERIAAVIDFYLESSRGIEGLRGCLVVGSAVEARTLDAQLQAMVAATLRSNQSMLEELIRRGRSDGSIAGAREPADAAQALLALLFGLRVLGKAGHPLRDDALRELALKILD